MNRIVFPARERAGHITGAKIQFAGLKHRMTYENSCRGERLA